MNDGTTTRGVQNAATTATCRLCGEQFIPTPKAAANKRWQCIPCSNKINREYRARRKAEGRPIKFKKPRRDKAHARMLLNRAIARGKITKQPCVVCGDLKSQGHHEDYSRPLDVLWLCSTHHSEVHQRGAA